MYKKMLKITKEFYEASSCLAKLHIREQEMFVKIQQ